MDRRKIIYLDDAIHVLKDLTANGTNKGMVFGEDAVHRIEMLPSVQQEIIRCKDCKYYKYGICMKIGANKSFYGFCDWAERGEQE